MASALYPSAKAKLWDGTIDLNTDTIALLLVTSSYTYSASHDYRDDITNEVAASGTYVAGGAALSGCTVSVVSGNAVFTFTAPSFTGATITARAAVLYKSRGGAASADELIAYLDFGSDQSCSGGSFTITPAGGGVLVY